MARESGFELMLIQVNKNKGPIWDRIHADIKIPRTDTIRFNHSAMLIQRGSALKKVYFNRMRHSNFRKSLMQFIRKC